MRAFKFLQKEITQHPLGRYVASHGRGCFIYNNGHTITKFDNTHPFSHNEIKHGDYAPFRFWWTHKYDRFELMNERPVSDEVMVETYEGTINRFTETYYNRRRVDNSGYFPQHPVITQIRCYGTVFYNEDLIFNHNDMWVEVSYKIFL